MESSLFCSQPCLPRVMVSPGFYCYYWNAFNSVAPPFFSSLESNFTGFYLCGATGSNSGASADTFVHWAMRGIMNPLCFELGSSLTSGLPGWPSSWHIQRRARIPLPFSFSDWNGMGWEWGLAHTKCLSLSSLYFSSFLCLSLHRVLKLPSHRISNPNISEAFNPPPPPI